MFYLMGIFSILNEMQQAEGVSVLSDEIINAWAESNI